MDWEIDWMSARGGEVGREEDEIGVCKNEMCRKVGGKKSERHHDAGDLSIQLARSRLAQGLYYYRRLV